MRVCRIAGKLASILFLIIQNGECFMNNLMKKRVLSKVLFLLLTFVFTGLMGSIVLANTNDNWRYLGNGNIAFYQSGNRVGLGSGPNGHFARNLFAGQDFFFNNDGILVRGLVNYGNSWHYFCSTHGTRLRSGISNWWRFPSGQLSFLNDDGTRARNGAVSITWDCPYGPGVATYLFDNVGYLITDYDFDLADGTMSVHSAFGEWHVVATHSFNVIGNFNAANGGGWLQTQPGMLRYLVADGTYVTGPAIVANGRTIIPANQLTNAWNNIPSSLYGQDFLFCVDGYLQFGWVYSNGTRVAYITPFGTRARNIHTTSDGYTINFGPQGTPASEWVIISPVPPHQLSLSLSSPVLSINSGNTAPINVAVYRAGYTEGLIVTAVPDWIGGPRAILPGVPFNQQVNITVPEGTPLGNQEIIFTVTPQDPANWSYRSSQTLNVLVTGSALPQHNLFIALDMASTATVTQLDNLTVDLLIGRSGYAGDLVITIDQSSGLGAQTWLPFTSVPVPTTGATGFQIVTFDIPIPRTALVAGNPHMLTFNVKSVSGAANVISPTNGADLALTVIFQNYDYQLFGLTVAPTAMTIRQNESATLTFTIDRGDHYTGPVEITHHSDWLPSPILIPAGVDSVTRNISIPWNANHPNLSFTSPLNIIHTPIIFTARAVIQYPPVGAVSAALNLNIAAIDTAPHELSMFSAHPPGGIPAQVTRDETLTLRFGVNRNGYGGALVVTASEDWAGGPWIIPTGATHTPFFNITVCGQAAFGANSVVFTVNSATMHNLMPSPVYSASVTQNLNVTWLLTDLDFPEDNWPNWTANQNVPIANWMIQHLESLHGIDSIGVITDPANNPHRLTPIWSYHEDDNPHHREFDPRSGAINIFRWYIPAEQLTAANISNRNNVPLTGTFNVTNEFNDLIEISLNPRVGPQPDIQLTHLVRNATEAIEQLNIQRPTAALITTLTPAGPGAAPIVWSFNPALNGGNPFDPSSEAKNTFRWEVILPPGVSAANIPLAGTIVITNKFAELTMDVNNIGGNISTTILPGVALNADEVIHYLNSKNYVVQLHTNPVTLLPLSSNLSSVVWSKDNPETFSYHSGAIHNFRWTITLHPGVANPNGYSLTGTHAITNFIFQATGFTLNPEPAAPSYRFGGSRASEAFLWLGNQRQTARIDTNLPFAAIPGGSADNLWTGFVLVDWTLWPPTFDTTLSATNAFDWTVRAVSETSLHRLGWLDVSTVNAWGTSGGTGIMLENLPLLSLGFTEAFSDITLCIIDESPSLTEYPEFNEEPLTCGNTVDSDDEASHDLTYDKDYVTDQYFVQSQDEVPVIY